MKTQRVLQIIGKMDRAGAETMLMNLYRHIDRTKVQFDFIVFTEEKGDYDDEILDLGGRIIPIIGKSPLDRMLKLYKFLKDNPEYQIIHSHVLLNNAFQLIAAKWAGVEHRIAHSHNTSNGNITVLGGLYEIWAKKTIQKLATYKIACGVDAANYLFGTDKDVHLLYNAIDIDAYHEYSLSCQNYWNEIRPNINGIKIIQVGRLNEVKNHAFSLEVAKKLDDDGIDFTFFIVGQGPLKNSIEQSIKNYGLRDKVHLLGVRDDVPQLMAGADVMVMPSLHEGFPVVLVESQAIGLRSIISNNISDEVDLGLHLTKAIGFHNINEWVRNIIANNSEQYDIKQSIKKMKYLNFDVKRNAKFLQNQYTSIINTEV